jgi:hypothetical protein
MDEIFISYKSSDKARVKVLVEALEREGWSVWWDREIPPGKAFDQVIEEALNAAKCVIVVWSKGSVVSDWVKTEASEGARRGVLVPVLIDDVKIPLEFRRIQAAWLVDWQGTLPHPGFEQLTEAVAAILGHHPTPSRAFEAPRQDDGKSLDEEQVRGEKPEKEAREDERYLGYQEKLEITPGRGITEEIKTRKWRKIVVGVGIVGLLMLAIFAYKFLPSADNPKIILFTASPESIETGEKSTLNWEIRNAKEVEIIGIGKVPLSGSLTVNPAQATTYTLIAENEKGNAARGKVTVEVRTPIPEPEISYFKASPTSIKKGDSSELTWETANAKEVEISGLGKVSLSGTERISPAETTVYSLIARNEKGESVQKGVTVEVGALIPPPEILEFSAKSSSGGFKLNWETSNAKEAEISGIGKVELSGSRAVNPTKTTTYRLTAENEEGETVEKAVTVEVRVSLPSPKIDYFVARPAVIERGNASTLNWKTSNAKYVEILRLGRVDRSGTKAVIPTETTSYILVAKNDEGKVEEEITVEVNARKPQPPVVELQDAMVKNPERYLTITDYSFHVAFNGTAMIHHVKIKNLSSIVYKNVKVRMRYYSGAGVEVSGDTKTLPVTIPPRSERTYLEGGFVVGVAPSNANARIEVVGALPVVNQ